MYTRDFSYENEGGINIPEKYSGTAFENEARYEEVHKGGESSEPVGNMLSSFSKLIPKKLFSTDVFKSIKGGFESFGTEELLIIAIALFLLFSKDGDRECAIMLLLVLFIN